MKQPRSVPVSTLKLTAVALLFVPCSLGAHRALRSQDHEASASVSARRESRAGATMSSRRRSGSDAAQHLDLKGLRRPGMVVFDLDATLWYPEMYHLWGGGAPFRKDPKSGDVIDRRGTHVRLMGDTRRILYELRTLPEFKDTLVAVASRTDEPEWAEECMQKMEVGDGITVKQCVDYEAIYGGDKSRHLKYLRDASKVNYEDMIFFDNERSNILHVSSVGIQSVFTPHGLTRSKWQDALREYDASVRARK